MIGLADSSQGYICFPHVTSYHHDVQSLQDIQDIIDLVRKSYSVTEGWNWNKPRNEIFQLHCSSGPDAAEQVGASTDCAQITLSRNTKTGMGQNNRPSN